MKIFCLIVGVCLFFAIPAWIILWYKEHERKEAHQEFFKNNPEKAEILKMVGGEKHE
jgi:hypothetical protein